MSLWGKIITLLGTISAVLTALLYRERGKVLKMEKEQEKASKELLIKVNKNIQKAEKRGKERLDKTRNNKKRDRFE